MFGRRKKPAIPPYDTAGKRPVIRASICTGEKVAGFRDEKTGHFEELMLLRSEEDLQEFLTCFQLSPDQIRYEW